MFCVEKFGNLETQYLSKVVEAGVESLNLIQISSNTF